MVSASALGVEPALITCIVLTVPAPASITLSLYCLSQPVGAGGVISSNKNELQFLLPRNPMVNAVNPP
jgi:hypothetical protein